MSFAGITEQERAFRAVREKDKGNDAFRIGDYKESLVYYTRSLTLQPTAAAFNNRAAAGTYVHVVLSIIVIIVITVC